MVRRRPAREDGFSLVELIVIIVILGILAAISIVTYLNQRQTAERASAISTLTNARLAAESIRSNNDNDYASDPDVYDDEQPAYDFLDAGTPSASNREVSVDGGGGSVIFAVRGRDRCYFMELQAADGEIVRRSATGVTCSASEFTDEVGIEGWG